MGFAIATRSPDLAGVLEHLGSTRGKLCWFEEPLEEDAFTPSINRTVALRAVEWLEKGGKSLAVVRDICFIFWCNYKLLYFIFIYFLNACPSASQVFNFSSLTPVVSWDLFSEYKHQKTVQFTLWLQFLCKEKFWSPAKIIVSSFLSSWKGQRWAAGVVTNSTKIVIVISQRFWFIS